MTRHENILSFDEARARGVAASEVSARKTASRSKTVAPSSRLSARPERLTYDPSFEQSFTATARSGSYQSSSRKRKSVRAGAAPARYTSNASLRSSAGSMSSRSAHVSSSRPAHGLDAEQRRAQQQPRPAIMDAQALEEELAEEQRNAASKKKKSIKHRVRSAKAERQFNKTIGAEDAKKAKNVAAEASGQSSRPALYQMKMGKTHKRSTRMQNGTLKKRTGLFGRLGGLFSVFNPRSPRFSSRALITGLAVVFTVVMLYQPVANYYQEMRQYQQLEAEYEVVSEYYSNLKTEVDYLNTKEGMEEYVREELGWVKSGEKVVSVEGLDPRDASAQKGSITADISSAVPTPETWYSGVLDIVFQYNKF